MIRCAQVSEASELTEIAKFSKAYWGYSKELLESWEKELTVTERIIKETQNFVYIYQDKIIGFYVLKVLSKHMLELEFLFVMPEFIGKGIGKNLLNHVIESAKNSRAKFIQVLSDPNASKFYSANGFVAISWKESTISGRFLPIMRLDLGNLK